MQSRAYNLPQRTRAGAVWLGWGGFGPSHSTARGVVGGLPTLGGVGCRLGRRGRMGCAPTAPSLQPPAPISGVSGAESADPVRRSSRDSEQREPTPPVPSGRDRVRGVGGAWIGPPHAAGRPAAPRPPGSARSAVRRFQVAAVGLRFTAAAAARRR